MGGHRLLHLATLEAIVTPLQLAQLKLKGRAPPPVSNSPQEDARAEWLYNSTEELLRGCSVSFQRRMRAPQGVTAEEFALVVDEYGRQRGTHPSARLVVDHNGDREW